MTPSVSVSLRVMQVAWDSSGWGSPNSWGKISNSSVHWLHIVFSQLENSQAQTCENGVWCIVSCITLVSCFTGRGLARTTSFSLTSGNLQATFSTAVSHVHCAVLGLSSAVWNSSDSDISLRRQVAGVSHYVAFIWQMLWSKKFTTSVFNIKDQDHQDESLFHHVNEQKVGLLWWV